MRTDRKVDPATMPKKRTSPIKGDVLVTDSDTAFVNVVSRGLQEIGCTCHVADTYTEALWQCLHGDKIIVAVLSLQEDAFDLETLIHDIRLLRPGVTIVGSGTRNRSKDFAALGVDRFLTKPWDSNALLSCLRATGAKARNANTEE